MTYSMHPAKIEIDVRLITLKIHKCKATKNSHSHPQSLHPNIKKQNNPIDLLPIISDNKSLYKKKKIIEKAKVERNGDMKWTHMNFNLPQRTKEFPQRKKNPQNLTPSHTLKLVSCLQLLSATLWRITQLGPITRPGARYPELVEDLYLPFKRPLSVWAHLCWRQARLLEPGHSHGPVSSTDHWFWLLTQILPTMLPGRVDSRFAPSQWETSLQSNTVWSGSG